MRFLIRNRDRKFPTLFDTALADSDIKVVHSGVGIPADEHNRGALDPDLPT